MGPDFVTSFFSLLSSNISKEQLALPSVRSDVSLCACRVRRSFTCVWQRSSLTDWARSGQMWVRCMPGLHARLGPHPVPSPASSFPGSCWPGHLSTKVARPHWVVVWLSGEGRATAWWASVWLETLRTCYNFPGRNKGVGRYACFEVYSSLFGMKYVSVL